MQSQQIKDHETVLRGLAFHDAESLERLLEIHVENQMASGLDPRTYSLVKVAGLIGMNGPAPSYAWQIGVAREAGVTNEDIMGVLVALAPTIGMARVVSAATEMALAMGMNLDEMPVQRS
jgi:alkylhydroperoxidase/carboxymuconolactone decarboxylase family protein YurZ